jgi:hypothetical protein
MMQNMATIVPNMLQFGWVSYFFSGFVIVYLPFPLTDRFKSMLQRGIMLKSLDPSYASSISWYLILLSGLQGVFSLVLGADHGLLAEDQVMKQQMMMGQGQGQMPDLNALFTAEKNELDISQHDFIIQDAEYKILGLTPPNRIKSS